MDMGISKNKRISKKPKKGPKLTKKFEVMFGATGDFVILGRSPFGTGAKNIAVNQDKAKGHVEDRRHILHYDEVLKPTIERVVGNLYKSEGRDKVRVARLVSQALQRRGVKRLPKNPDKVMERLVTEINSAPDNLIPDRADTNKAIEVVRGYLRKYIVQISTSDFAEDCSTDNHARMGKYKQLARETFVRDASGSEITGERNRIHGEILGFIDGCQGPAQLWVLVHEMVHSVTFDFSPKITRDATAKAIEWQKTMARNEDSEPEKQLDALVGLLA
jgi:uncharacterized protein YdbL (DUF1318 family)